MFLLKFFKYALYDKIIVFQGKSRIFSEKSDMITSTQWAHVNEKLRFFRKYPEKSLFSEKKSYFLWMCE